MKKSKFLKALLALVLGIVSAVSVFGVAACTPDNGGGGGGGNNATVTEVTVDSLHGERSL